MGGLVRLWLIWCVSNCVWLMMNMIVICISSGIVVFEVFVKV